MKGARGAEDISHQLCARGDVQFSEDPYEPTLNGPSRNVELLGYLEIGKPLTNEFDDRDLVVGKRSPGISSPKGVIDHAFKLGMSRHRNITQLSDVRLDQEGLLKAFRSTLTLLMLGFC